MIDRRTLLVSSASLATVGLLGSRSGIAATVGAGATSADGFYDLIIVGAGTAGLPAAITIGLSSVNSRIRSPRCSTTTDDA